jgi:DNA processing protein
VMGQIEVLQHPQRLAIVGSRNPTPQGQANAHAFARALGEAGVCVVSGLALGVDGAAHTGALDGGAPTIAVVGTGLDRVYPKRHLALAHRIAAHGAIVSEYALGTPPIATHFPQRNRIIAGLSQGTLVVEAAVQSGSLITARLAAEQGREVFAIPGSIHAPQSRGCHALIRQGAKLVESAQDILEDLHLTQPETRATEGKTGAEERSVADPDGLLAALGHDPVGLDALQARTGLDTPHLQARLFELELQGDVARLPGGLLQRLVRG